MSETTIEDRFVIDCELTTPLRLSTGDESLVADAAAWRRTDGSLVIPGASITGALRQHVERIAGVDHENGCLIYREDHLSRDPEAEPCGCEVCQLFGDVRPVKKANPSRVRIFEAPIEAGTVNVTDGVSLNRHRRAAAEGRKFDFEQVAAGAKVRIEVRTTGATEAQLGLLGSALKALGSEEIPLGGRTATGFGRLRAWAASHQRRDLLRDDDLVHALLFDGDPAWPESSASGLDQLPGSIWHVSDRESIELTLSVAPESSILVADPTEAVVSGFDRAPRGGANEAELPGSSLRGALRSGAERILRTLGDEVCDPTDKRASCAALGKGDTRCRACQLFGNEERASKLMLAVKPVGDASKPAPFDHVAIDRFTGGAREGLKFDALAARNRSFWVRLDLTEPDEEKRLWMRGLILLALRDLARGRITVGYGSARGHGWFRFNENFNPGDDAESAVGALWQELR